MTNSPDKTVNSVNPTAQEIGLVTAYEQSADQDIFIDQELNAALNDGLADESAFRMVKNILSNRF